MAGKTIYRQRAELIEERREAVRQHAPRRHLDARLVTLTNKALRKDVRAMRKANRK